MKLVLIYLWADSLGNISYTWLYIYIYIYTQYQKYAYFVFKHCEHNAIFNSGHLKDLAKTQNTLWNPESWENHHPESLAHRKQMAAEDT